jgi:SAM-dependent methyltransferase
MLGIQARCPDPQGAFRRFHDRLAQFRPIANMQNYWKQHWEDPSRRQELIPQGEAGDLGEYKPLLERYVPRDLPVLEAGCGLGQMVNALTLNGYKTIGIDYEPETIKFVREQFPRLDVRVGNIKKLDFPDATFGCYMSLGVMEHFEVAPEDAMREARRVLHPRGVALISVPYLNAARRASLGQLNGHPAPRDGGLEFYQYYYSYEEFTGMLTRAGLKVIDYLPLFVDHMLTREHPVFQWYWRSPLCRFRMKAPLRRYLREGPKWLRRRYAHMLMYVAQRVDKGNDEGIEVAMKAPSSS